MTSPQSEGFIAIDDAPLIVGRAAGSDLRIENPSVSGRHATLRRDGGNVFLEDLNSRFGTFVNGHQVKSKVLRLGDRVRFGAASYYRVEHGGLRLDDASVGLSLRAEGLRLVKDGKVIVDGASFNIVGETFVGIIGPSGSGKSTLLNCVAGFLVPQAGQLFFDADLSAFQDIESYKANLAYVPQEDEFHGDVTVKELLDFAAALRFGPAVDHESLEKRVADTLESLTLTGECKKQAKDISGGQKKRAGVAIELIKQPRLLLLDEPTSPLDPATEAALMAQLRGIARRGTTVVCTTHKMDNLSLFDLVVVLGILRPNASDENGVGIVAYTGAPEAVLEHFECRTYADLFRRLAKGEFHFDEQPPPATSASQRDVSPTESDSRAVTPVGSSGSDSWLLDAEARHQARILIRRTLRVVLRDRGLVRTLLLQPLVLGALVAFTQYGADKGKTVLFFAGIIAIWLGLNNSVRELVMERAIFVRERLAGLRSFAYLGSKLVCYSGVGIAQLLVLLTVLAVCTTLHWFADDTATSIGRVSLFFKLPILFAAYVGGLGLGLTVSAVSRTQEQAVAALPLLIMPQILISAVSAGLTGLGDDQPAPFRPLVVTVRSDARYQDTNKRAEPLLDVASLLCLSRPTSILLEWPTDLNNSRWPLVADACHLLILVLVSWVIAIVTFTRCEPRWAKQLKLA